MYCKWTFFISWVYVSYTVINIFRLSSESRKAAKNVLKIQAEIHWQLLKNCSWRCEKTLNITKTAVKLELLVRSGFVYLESLWEICTDGTYLMKYDQKWLKQLLLSSFLSTNLIQKPSYIFFFILGHFLIVSCGMYKYMYIFVELYSILAKPLAKFPWSFKGTGSAL